jgi:hypothetical protein
MNSRTATLVVNAPKEPMFSYLSDKANKDPESFKTILLTYPNIEYSNTPSRNSAQRPPMTGTARKYKEISKIVT